jgi:hypothetical protein
MLLASSALTALFSLLLGIGLNLHNQILSGLSVVAFVISFSLGLAPMAWVILPEVMPKEGRTAGSSVAVSVNWITNFVAVRQDLGIELILRGPHSYHCNNGSSTEMKARDTSFSSLL